MALSQDEGMVPVHTGEALGVFQIYTFDGSGFFNIYESIMQDAIENAISSPAFRVAVLGTNAVAVGLVLRRRILRQTARDVHEA